MSVEPSCPRCTEHQRGVFVSECSQCLLSDLRSFKPTREALQDALNDIEADRDALRDKLDLVHGAIRADDERLYAAWVRIHGAPDDCANIGCDAPEWMADEILRLRAELERTKEELEMVRIASALLLAESDDVMDRYESRCPIQAGELQRAIDNCRSALERKAGA